MKLWKYAAVLWAVSATAWAAEPAAAPQTAAEPGKAAAPAPAAGPATRRSSDRLDLDTTVVTGNRELPKVLYIVPWKKADLGDLPAQPFNTLLDETLTPVDRDVFRREVTYYGAIAADAAPAGKTAPTTGNSTARPTGGTEK